MKEKPYAVVFSGVPGTSKSSIADYLSWNFDIGVLRSDSVRYEVKEDMRVESLSIGEDLDFHNPNGNGALEEFERRINERRHTILALGKLIILDGSVDRRWESVRQELLQNGYDWFMINMELSEKFLKDLYTGTGRESFIPQLEGYLRDHAKFLDAYRKDISLEINDGNFRGRLKIAASGLQNYIESMEEQSAIG